MNYSIITAVRNEALYVSKTLKSVATQNHLPLEWIIINDGSTDNTANIVQEYESKHSWIKKTDLFDFRNDLVTTGGRVGHLLNLAAKKMSKQADIIVKLDADTEFEADFFERIMAAFENNPNLGIASGHLVFEGVPEKIATENSVRGAVLAIRKEVFESVGGFFESRGRGEDTLFGVAARAKGWDTVTVPVYFNHLKPEGVRHSSVHQSYVTGYYKGSIPYRLDYFLLTQLKHIFKKPIVLGTVLQLIGYFNSRFIKPYRPFPDFVKEQLHKEQRIFKKIQAGKAK